MARHGTGRFDADKPNQDEIVETFGANLKAALLKMRLTRAQSGSELEAHFGRTGREARQKARLTQAALVDQTGLTQQYIARIEAGQVNPTLATMAATASVLYLDGGDMLRQAGPSME
jgi:DNA-binding XRE family transcriptional regulator